MLVTNIFIVAVEISYKRKAVLECNSNLDNKVILRSISGVDLSALNSNDKSVRFRVYIWWAIIVFVLLYHVYTAEGDSFVDGFTI